MTVDETILADDACNPNATEKQREWLIVFAVLAANKPAQRMWRLTEALVGRFGEKKPFKILRGVIARALLLPMLRGLRTGQYTRIDHALRALVESEIDLFACTPEDLEAIPGIGPKTARWFILRTQANARVAALDTHILKWMRARGYDVPKSTPTGKRYAEIEQQFLGEAEAHGKTPAEMDLLIWQSYAERTGQ